MQIDRFAYRPEIDGLRAIAVSSVVLFHLNHQWLPGGFVGVDIFFVISGYLITSILLQDCEARRFSLLKFYQRRIARIFPAFFAVALATVAAAWLVHTPQDFASTGAVLVAASLSVANIKFIFQGNYFEASPDAQPFLHYWSLSVEEQFYILFPIAIYLVFSYARRQMVAVLALMAVLSLIACIAVTRSNPTWAFYLLPTRAWELCVGCMIAAIPFTSNGSKGTTAPGWLAPAGLFLIVASLFLISEGSHFPGWIAVLPVAGSAAIILPSRNPLNAVSRGLASAPAVILGRMSYSLYLWHWPVFCLVDYYFYTSSEMFRLCLKIGACGSLTAFTYHVIEVPVRAFLNRESNRWLAYAAFAAILAFCVPLGMTIRAQNYVNAELSDVAKGGVVFAADPHKRTVILMGDSNGSMYGRTMRQICEKLQYRLTVVSVDAGDPLPSTNTTSSQLWNDALAVVRANRPDYLVIANSWSAQLRADPARLAMAIRDLQPSAKHIILLNQPPILPKEASRASIRGGATAPFFESAANRVERHKVNDFLRSFEAANISVIDIAQHFETARGEVIHSDDSGRLLFQDSGHLSGYGAERVRPALEGALKP